MATPDSLTNFPGYPHGFVESLKFLDAELRARRKLTNQYENYYRGEHRLAFATQKFRDAFGDLFGGFADNWCGVIVDTPAERLAVDGFKKDSDSVDTGSWNFWVDNDMELLSDQAMTGAIKCGVSYVLVDRTGEKPNITVWPASMAIVHRDPKTRKAIRGLTTWTEDDGKIGCEVFLPVGSQRFVSEDAPGDAAVTSDAKNRVWIAVGEMVDNPHEDGSIPLVEFVNRPNELGKGRSDIDDVIPLQDAINKLTNDMIVASEFAAYPQRVLTGIEIPKDPTTGEPLQSEQLVAAISRVWSFENPEAKVYDLSAADLNNYTTGIKELLNHLAAQTRTPPHYLIGQMVNVSGEALAAAESGLVSRVQQKQKSFGISWREVVRLSTGEEGLEIVWHNPERVSLAAVADAVSKLMATAQLALPREEGLRMLGFSPIQIEDIITLMDKRLPGQTGGVADPTQPPQVPPAA